MRTVNLQTELLRTFVTVIELGSFTKAAEQLGRTQPAVTLQIQRLEQLVAKPLVRREGKVILLTEHGEKLAAHARQMLRINDLAVAQFERSQTGHKIRIGLPVDFALHMLQRNTTEVIKKFPTQQIEIKCDLSKNLIDDLRNNDLDIAVALFDGHDQQFLFDNWLVQPAWVAAPSFDIKANQQIPLVVHPYGCVYREIMTEALKSASFDWRIAYTSPGIGGLQQAVRDGLGISCLTGPTIQDGICNFSELDILPNLPMIHIGLFARQAQLAAASYSIIDKLTSVLATKL